MAKEKYQAVTFLNAAGEEISNDPRWLAERTLREAGVEVSADADTSELTEEIAAKDAEIEALKAALAAKEAEESLDDEDEPTGNYSDVKGKDLTALAKERGISLKGEDGKNKTAGDVRAELVAQDQAN